MDLDHQLNIQLEQSLRGRELWLKLVEQTKLGQRDYIVLFPSSDSETNYFGLLYLNQFIESKKANKVHIVTNDRKVIKAYPYFSVNVENCHHFSYEDIEALLCFYKLYKFTDKLIIVELDGITGRSTKNLLEIPGLTLQELISVGVYQLRKFVQQDRITYNDNDLIAFFKNY